MGVFYDDNGRGSYFIVRQGVFYFLGMKHRRKWDEIRKKWLLWLYYHSPILLLGFSYDAYMMLLSCSYVKVFGFWFKVYGLRFKV